jgi:hypothetical protein
MTLEDRYNQLLTVTDLMKGLRTLVDNLYEGEPTNLTLAADVRRLAVLVGDEYVVLCIDTENWGEALYWAAEARASLLYK